MWFADIGVVLGEIALAAWALTAVLAYALPRRGRRRPALLLSPLTRLPVVVGSGAVALLFAMQAGVVDTVADTSGVGLVDHTVWAWFVTHRTPGLTAVMRLVSTLGGTAGMAVLAVVAAAILWIRRRRADAVIVLVAALGASALVTGFKNLYARDRPPLAQRLTAESNAALPSGHSLGSMVVLGILAAVVVLTARRAAVQALALLTAAGGIAAIGIGRLYLGVHWMTDVLTGWVLGGAWLAACVTALLVRNRRAAHRSPPRCRSGRGSG